MICLPDESKLVLVLSLPVTVHQLPRLRSCGLTRSSLAYYRLEHLNIAGAM